MRLIDADALMEILTTAIRNMQGMAKFLGAEDDPEIQMEIKAYTDIAEGVKDMPTIESERLSGRTVYQAGYADGYKAGQAERKKGKWTTEEVAELLFNMFGEECACNFNNIDEWLPESCKYAETTCPNPTEKHGCWMQFLLQGGAKMEGEQS